MNNYLILNIFACILSISKILCLSMIPDMLKEPYELIAMNNVSMFGISIGFIIVGFFFIIFFTIYHISSNFDDSLVEWNNNIIIIRQILSPIFSSIYVLILNHSQLNINILFFSLDVFFWISLFIVNIMFSMNREELPLEYR